MWAVLLGVMLVLVAATTAHAAIHGGDLAHLAHVTATLARR
jgi:hypothetical protein